MDRADGFRDPTAEPAWVRRLLIATAMLLLGGIVLLPLAVVIAEALRHGWAEYFEALVEPDTLSAIKLTLLVAALSVPANADVNTRISGSTTKIVRNVIASPMIRTRTIHGSLRELSRALTKSCNGSVSIIAMLSS